MTYSGEMPREGGARDARHGARGKHGGGGIAEE